MYQNFDPLMNPTGRKAAKKIRKLYREDLKDTKEMLAMLIRPKPWFIPRFAWLLLVRIIIKDIKL